MAGVIKRQQTASASAFSLQDFEAYARKLVRDAKEEAQQIRAAARRAAADEAERIRAAAHEEGRAAGRAAGLEQIRQEATERVRSETAQRAEQAVAALTQGLRSFEQQKHRLLAQAERGVLELALAIARRVCKRLPTLGPEAAIGNARHALLTAGRAGDLELRINPDEHTAVAEWAAEFLTNCETLDHVQVVADADVAPGGCMVRGRYVTIDATLDTQLERVAAALCDEQPPEAET